MFFFFLNQREALFHSAVSNKMFNTLQDERTAGLVIEETFEKVTISQHCLACEVYI